MQTDDEDKKTQASYSELIRNFIIELIVYGILLVIYFFVALRFLAEPLRNLFDNNLIVYAVIGLGLIVVQAVFLEFVTSLLFDFLGLNRLTSKPGQH
ncbi:MAG: hypothetical protein GWN14_27335 [candidate division Zixibacteria bacterium]|nr:hypothetical protein [Gammaproteobacteria bacterium]NIX59537.1 hypothetical protein [candidate division Zixibacteria bacterium]